MGKQFENGFFVKFAVGKREIVRAFNSKNKLGYGIPALNYLLVNAFKDENINIDNLIDKEKEITLQKLKTQGKNQFWLFDGKHTYKDAVPKKEDETIDVAILKNLVEELNLQKYIYENEEKAKNTKDAVKISEDLWYDFKEKRGKIDRGDIVVMDNRTVTDKLNELMKYNKDFTDDNFKIENVSKEIRDTVAGCIGEVYIIEQDEKTKKLKKSEPYDPFKNAPAFDRGTMNFHVFPDHVEKYNIINDQLKLKVEEMKKVLKKDEYKAWNFKIHGMNNNFPKYTNWLNSQENKKNFERGNIYKYLSVYYHDRCYNMNFMRFYQTQNEFECGKVNCDFYSLQYDCISRGECINYVNSKKIDVCYPFSAENGECHINSVGNICYNPHISFYDEPETILKSFLDFISFCDKMITKKNNEIEAKINKNFISSQQFADVLRKSTTSTPLTKKFEEEKDKNGERTWGQKKDRWWDNSTGEQKEHLVCWFSRKFNGGSTEECMKNNLGSNCENCYFSKIEKKPSGFGEQIDAQLVFERMRRPEMYFHIAESLGVLERNQLEKFIEEVKVNIDNWRNIRKKYLSWDMVKAKVKELL